MKRILLLGLLFVCGTLAAQASQWGALARADDQVHAKRTKPANPFHILRKLSSGKPVNIFLTLETEELEQLRKGYQDQLSITYQDWFDITRGFINQTGKQHNFLAVLVRLQKPPKVQFVADPQAADLRVVIARKRQTVLQNCSNKEKINFDVEACVSREEKIPVFYMPSYDLLQEDITQVFAQQGEEISEEELEDITFGYFVKVMRHEIGHTLGLADQYESANPAAVSHRMYRSTHVRQGIMNGEGNYTCDDADGIVNLLDIMYKTEKNRRQGWHSLCPDSPDVYIDGVAQGTGPYTMSKDKEKWVLVTYGKDGRKQKEQKFTVLSIPDPLRQIPDSTVLARDGFGRPVKTEGPAKEIIYYTYNYQWVHRLITRNGKAVRREIYKDEEQPVQDEPGQFQRTLYVEWEFRLPNQEMGEVSMYSTQKVNLTDYYEGNRENPSLSISISQVSGFDDEVQIKGSNVAPENASAAASRQGKLERVVQQKETDDLVKRVQAWGARQRRAWENGVSFN
ncbi:MAG: hypothetical protein II913_05430 [Elusimicrobiaceae bacterium]|nr:hypothetical protein [Elusimicrobiaceae bacterium]